MKRSIPYASALSLLLVVTGCGGQADLDAAEAVRAVTRARAVTRTLTAYTAITTPLFEQPCTRSIDDAAAAYLEATDGCATASSEDTSHVVVSMTDCSLEGAICSGELTIVPAPEKACWALEPTGVTCTSSQNDVYRFDGAVTVLPFDDHGKILQIQKAKEEKYISSLDAVLVANALTMNIDRVSVRSYAVTGNIEFGDDHKALWLAEAQELLMLPFDGTPRGGVLLLDSPAGTLYRTSWLPVSRNATRVVIQSRKQSWTGCIELEGAGECKAAGY